MSSAKETRDSIVKKNRKRDILFWRFKQQLARNEARMATAATDLGAVARHIVYKGDASDEEMWKANLTVIRNRVTNTRRGSRERWNRFAGTDAAGARGL